MAERTIAPALKAGGRKARGFESLPFRHRPFVAPARPNDSKRRHPSDTVARRAPAFSIDTATVDRNQWNQLLDLAPDNQLERTGSTPEIDLW